MSNINISFWYLDIGIYLLFEYWDLIFPDRKCIKLGSINELSRRSIWIKG